VTAASRLVTVGEALVALTPPAVGPLRLATSLGVSIAGAEANVAIAVRRLGGEASWIGRVGADELGELIMTRLRGEGVDVSMAIRDPGAPTSLLLKERRTGDVVRVGYYRRSGPGSRLDPSDLDEDAIRAAGVLHVTGITPALSTSARACVRAAVEVARAAGVTVSLDFNHRQALWTAEAAAAELRDLTRLADVVFAGEAEAGLVVDEEGPAAQAAGLARLGPRQVVITRGPEGAAALIDGVPVTVAAHPVRVLDPVGAGDAFVGGYLAELLAGADAPARLATAARCGAFAVTVAGDWEGLPSRAELGLLDAGARDVVR
jgi:2-dehydro-3-deoxygluconokinase